MARTARTGTDDVIIIKKYANRRLYNTQKSSYITLDDLAEMTRSGKEFKVVDAKTEEDITHSVLTQIIMDEEARGENMLPVNFLRQLIGMYGNSMQGMVPQYLEASMDALRKNQMQFLEGAFAGNPLAEMAKRNMAMFEAATSAFRPASGDASRHDALKDAEIADLRAQVEALKATIETLKRGK